MAALYSSFDCAMNNVCGILQGSTRRGVERLVTGGESRFCPDCGSDDVDVTQRGYAGRTDERHQFYQCRDCGRLTFEILSRTAREMKLDRLETGQVIEHESHTYRIVRMLKIGVDEHLIYLKADNEARKELRNWRRPRPRT
jgi:Zn finger protein HypA/HybF involved in hydrogenase expression